MGIEDKRGPPVTYVRIPLRGSGSRRQRKGAEASSGGASLLPLHPPPLGPEVNPRGSAEKESSSLQIGST